jgi:hypothetical protein
VSLIVIIKCFHFISSFVCFFESAFFCITFHFVLSCCGTIYSLFTVRRRALEFNRILLVELH